jgi:hypothetical protein
VLNERFEMKVELNTWLTIINPNAPASALGPANEIRERVEAGETVRIFDGLECIGKATLVNGQLKLGSLIGEPEGKARNRIYSVIEDEHVFDTDQEGEVTVTRFKVVCTSSDEASPVMRIVRSGIQSKNEADALAAKLNSGELLE